MITRRKLSKSEQQLCHISRNSVGIPVLSESTVKTAFLSLHLLDQSCNPAPLGCQQQKKLLPRQIVRMSSINVLEKVENSPRIANCFTGSFGGPRDRLFTILKGAIGPSQPPTICRSYRCVIFGPSMEGHDRVDASRCLKERRLRIKQHCCLDM
jgi:hypothetical protein